MEKKLVLIDGNSIAYRAFFALPLLNNNKGIHTNAIYGFAMMLLKILETEKPSHVAVAFDIGKKTFRHDKFDDYKGGRQKTPPELSEQFPFIRELLDAFNINQVGLENYEADDLIGTYAKIACDENIQTKIISGDKDLLQLVTHCTVVSLTKKGITETEDFTIEHLHEKYGLKPDQMIEMKGLMGDKSDNIPGVPGVGEKTALKLLHEYGNLENIYENIDAIPGAKLKEKLIDNKDLAFLSRELATIHKEVPIELAIDNTVYNGMDAQKVAAFFKDLGFNSLLSRVEPKLTFEERVEKLTEQNVTILNDFNLDIVGDSAAIYLQLENENYHKANIIGLGIKSDQGLFYISWNDFIKNPNAKVWLESGEHLKYTFDAKKVYASLKWQDINVKSIAFDLMIAKYILDPASNIEDVHSAIDDINPNIVSTDESVFGKGVSKKIPEIQKLAEHVARKALAIWEVRVQIEQQLQEHDSLELFSSLELPLSFILADMEVNGFKIDVGRLEEMKAELGDRISNLEKKIFEIAGTEFNINSPKQLGVVLFEKLQLPVEKKTKTGYSTSADVLEKLRPYSPIIEEILTYRQLCKLQSTYVEGLLKVTDSTTSKIHTRFNQALTQTGRLSSVEPNLQNIPIRLEEGRKIRQAFIPSNKNAVIFAADYSQIELRVLAHIAKDEGLIKAFNEGLDIHTKTAMDVFHVEKDAVTSLMRRHAKAVNFGIVYGISDFGLSQNLGITRKEAGEFIKKYFESFPGVKQYMEDIVKKVRHDGYVTTLLNRRRYIPDINNRNFNIKSFAERTAMNTPIQGSAADIIKKAMIDVSRDIKANNLQSKLLLQVHDELVFEVPVNELDKLTEIVIDTMENAIELDVPLKVDYDSGETWFDTK
ncbi:MAG: polA [Bacillales bacterium]|jgi:DNA polymerase-1|nr:polA [Bacillales bacterium]